MITLKRAYDPVTRADGIRFLVERLWPRGIAKVDLVVDEWLKEVAPSTGLRYSSDLARNRTWRPAVWMKVPRHSGSK